MELDIFKTLSYLVKFYRPCDREHYQLFSRSSRLLLNVMCLAQPSYLRCHEHRCFINNLHHLAYSVRAEEELVPYHSTIGLLLQVI
jgi:hypothetical protein